jgi:hypothetical protein
MGRNLKTMLRNQMNETQIYEYYAFGYNYYLLRYPSPGTAIHGDDNSLLSRIDSFFRYLYQLDLPVTRRAASDLSDIRKDLKETTEDAVVDKALAEKVTKAIDKLDTTLDAELGLRSAFVVSPKRIDVSKLTSNVASLFAPDVFWKLPSIAQYDLSEAGMCIAFQRPTAAAFHLMRATESVLRQFYCRHVKRNRVDLMWGPIIQSLNSQKKFRNL